MIKLVYFLLGMAVMGLMMILLTYHILKGAKKNGKEYEKDI